MIATPPGVIARACRLTVVMSPNTMGHTQLGSVRPSKNPEHDDAQARTHAKPQAAAWWYAVRPQGASVWGSIPLPVNTLAVRVSTRAGDDGVREHHRHMSAALRLGVGVSARVPVCEFSCRPLRVVGMGECSVGAVTPTDARAQEGARVLSCASAWGQRKSTRA